MLQSELAPPLLTSFRQDYLSHYPQHKDLGLILGNKVGMPEVESVLATFFRFMEDEQKWQKVLRMYRTSEEIATLIRVYISALNVSFNALPLMKQLMTANELLVQGLQNGESMESREVYELQRDHLNKLLVQLQNFLSFVEKNLTVETDQLSQEVIQASEYAKKIMMIEKHLSNYPKEMEAFGEGFAKYTQESAWLQLSRNVPVQVDEDLKTITELLDSLNSHVGTGVNSETFALTTIHFCLKRIFLHLTQAELPPGRRSR